MNRPTLTIVIGSTRPGRVGKPVADWIAKEAAEHGRFDIDVADLDELQLPLLNEPNHPRLGNYVHDKTKQWSSIIARADAILFVIPEYNHSFNAATKNAIDYLHTEWRHKPGGIVSYGGVSAGTRAAAALRIVLSALGMILVPSAVNIPFVSGFLDGDGAIAPNEEMKLAATAILDDILQACGLSSSWRTSSQD